MRDKRVRGVWMRDRRRGGFVDAHRFSLLVNSLINLLDRVDFEVSLRLGLRFYHSNSTILFCSPLQVHFSIIKHLLLAFVFKK